MIIAIVPDVTEPDIDRADPKLAAVINRVEVTENGCWEFTGARDPRGYGRISRKCYGFSLAHRFVYDRVRGTIPDGHYVCHACDNPSCINPSHLFAGTSLDNNQDMRRKGRGVAPPRRRFSANGFAKLSDDDVRHIKQEFIRNFELTRGGWRTNARELAEQYGCTDANIRVIARGKAWEGFEE